MVTQNFARTSAPLQLDQNIAPTITVDDISIAKLSGARKTKLKKHMEVTDGDGDSPVWYELLDTKGRDNFVFKGQGRIDASEPYRVDAADLSMIRVATNFKTGTTTLKIRAFDGEDVGEWEEFSVTTYSADDWLALG